MNDLPTTSEINNPQGLDCMKEQIMARQERFNLINGITDTEAITMEQDMSAALDACQTIFGAVFPRLPVQQQEILIHMAHDLKGSPLMVAAVGNWEEA